MYATVHDRFETLRSKALSNEYTQAALTQFDAYKQQLVSLHADTTERLQARRDALLETVQGRRDNAVAAFRERRDSVVSQIDSVKTAAVEKTANVRATVTEAASAPVTRATELVNSTRAAAADAIAPHQDKIDTVIDMAFAWAAAAIYYMLAMWFAVVSVIRTHAPKAVEVGQKSVSIAMPYAEKALALVFGLDARLGGYVHQSVQRLQGEVKAKAKQE